MTRHIQNTAYVQWKLPIVDYAGKYEGLPDAMDYLRDSRIYEVMLSFLAKFTNLEKEKLECFADDFDIGEMINPLISSLQSCSIYPHTELGGVFGSSGNCRINRLQRHDFLYLLLKCKYSHRQCKRIIEYYDNHPLTVGDEAKTPKDIASLMVRSENGIEPYGYDFIKNVQLDPGPCADYFYFHRRWTNQIK